MTIDHIDAKKEIRDLRRKKAILLHVLISFIAFFVGFFIKIVT